MPAQLTPGVRNAWEAKIANATGFSQKNTEPLQILRYTSGGEYQAHHDFIQGQQARPPGPRVFTFFMYLNDVPPGGGGATWFPNASRQRAGRTISEPQLTAFYSKYSLEKAERLARGGRHDVQKEDLFEHICLKFR